MENCSLGQTGLSVTPLCLGTSALGSFPSLYGYEVSTEQAVATLLRVFEGPINFIDTSNNYFEAERRIGRALHQIGGLPPGFVLATKVDPEHGATDFSGARVRASVEESLQRLGVDHLQLVYLHDPERLSFDEAMAAGGPVEALMQLQSEGVVDHVGVAGGPIDLMWRYLELEQFQAIISHNRYTLVDSSVHDLIDEAARRGVAFVNGAPYGGGMLVKGPHQQPNYCYQPASAETLARVVAMEAVCRSSTIGGMSAPERIQQTLELATWPIGEELWDELRPLTEAGRGGIVLRS